MLGRTIVGGLLCAVALVSAFGLSGAAWAAAPTPTVMPTLEITAPDCSYRDCPVTVEVKAPAFAKSVILLGGEGRVAAQLWRDADKTLLSFILPELKQGAPAIYHVLYDDSPAREEGVSIRKAEDAVEILIGGKLFTRYIISGAPKPYCYPIIGPLGDPITRDFPMKKVEGESTDHPHQRSLWFTHGGVNGTDYWLEGEKGGKQIHRGFDAIESGPVMGRILERADWVKPDGKKDCEDIRDIRFYNVANGRLFDWTLTVRATEGPVTFMDTKEGTFGFRVAESMRPDKKQGGKILNSEGQTDDAAWGQPATWCDYSGPVKGNAVGIMIMDHPGSLRHPTYWHVRTYGLFAANPFGLHDFVKEKKADKSAGEFTIPKGGATTFRYRIFIHKGTAEEAKVADAYAQYVKPPKVIVR